MIAEPIETGAVQLLNTLTSYEWEDHFDETSFFRGERYYRSGRVISVIVSQVEDNSLTLRGYVRGSRSKPYKAEVELTDDYDQFAFANECTCPLGGDCKHIVALLLQAESPATYRQLQKHCTQPDPNGELPVGQALNPQLQAWVERVRAGFSGGTGSDPFILPKPSKRRIIFLLTDIRPYRGPSAPLYLDVKVATQNKIGFSETNVNSPDTSRWEWERPAYLSEGDEKLVTRGRLLCNTQSTTFPLKGEGVAEWLRQVVDTGRCFWEKPGRKPLAWGEPRPGKLDWKLNDAGVLNTAITTTPPSHSATAADPPVYLDVEQASIGFIELPEPPAVVETWLDAPPVTQAQADSLTASLGTLPEPSRVPSPSDFKVRTLAVKPRFLARCFRTTPAKSKRGWFADQTHNMRVVEIIADYDGHQFPCFNGSPAREMVRDGDGMLKIERDVDAETEAWRVFTHARFQRLIGQLPQHEVKEDCHHLFAPKPDYYALNSHTNQWVHFIANLAPKLRDQGWEIEIAEDFGIEVIIPDEDDWFTDIEEEKTGIEWFSLRFGIEIDGKEIDVLPVLQQLLENGFDPETLEEDPDQKVIIAMPDGSHLLIPVAKLRLPLTFLHELFGTQVGKDGSMRIHKLRAAQISALDPNQTALRKVNKALEEMGKNLANFTGLKRAKTPRGVKAEMRPYQQDGLAWLQFLRKAGLGGVLADDMGLGKTLQTLAHLQAEKLAGRSDLPNLIVAPTSVVHNWLNEANKFVPNMSVLVLHGPERKDRFAEIPKHNLVVTSYPLVHRDADELGAYNYHTLVLDEAQHIKNPKAKAGVALRDFNARHRLCLTGTPMENHLGELWSLFHFLVPGFLGTPDMFRKVFRTPIEKNGDSVRQKALADRVAPLMLRRKKEAVAKDLPAKTDIGQHIELYAEQKSLYETVRAAMDKKVRDAIKKKGIAQSSIIVLDALLKLRQICCHPALLKQASAKAAKKSAKLDRLVELIPELVQEGRRILLFSQFTSMLSLIEAELEKQKLGYLKLTGSTRNRPELVDRFQNGDVPVFLISLKAGGTGLNLTAADTVIHYDPWWNPAVENQATDRAHRIGQEKPVFVHKLICTGSIEERIQELQAKKAGLAEGILTGKAEKLKLTEDDLKHLFAPL